jgi:hypothetical protein
MISFDENGGDDDFDNDEGDENVYNFDMLLMMLIGVTIKIEVIRYDEKDLPVFSEIFYQIYLNIYRF